MAGDFRTISASHFYVGLGLFVRHICPGLGQALLGEAYAEHEESVPSYAIPVYMCIRHSRTLSQPTPSVC
jgi:hypothetical protein